jgi:secreted trypsin-like serine protease
VAVHAIQEDGSTQHICDGTVISAEVVLTSASCVHRSGKMVMEDELVLLLGYVDPEYDTVHELENEIVREVKSFIMHPTFKINDDNSYSPDFAMIVMSSPVRFNSKVRSMCLSRHNDIIDNNAVLNGIVVTWQHKTIGVTTRSVPQIHTVPVVSSKSCLAGKLQSNSFCSGKISEASSCDVTPGSGLLMRSNEGWTLRGIVSKNLIDPTTKKCNLDASFVFADLREQPDWIMDTASSQKSLPLLSDDSLLE